ncbi:unnamed protein product [Polarella glacialis]|uniref:G domain-containing protein n=1 Tax=Polarella glacialis TaxID=89957 RepID=A0A813KMR5_POLGL|nr:unnamed protein product [Polarella glacialis]CAE8703385.1 unnamed protein product [Polarella glacialis]|mmetsp:Transcript_99992/g.180406  ORF Transcript_99992/g.180406 Transcript_99992/m.180406 type:complete len:418 (+) Transcript_99992:100-1353(+)
MRRFTPCRNAFSYGRPYPDFVPRERFNFEGHPHWFVGHMSSGKVKIERKMKDVNILLEVRDARAPFSSSQYELTANVGEHVHRLIVLNKADLVTPNVGLSMRSLIEESGQPCLLTNASENKNLIKIKQFALDNVRAKHPRTLGLMLMVVGLPNVGKSTIVNGLKRIAFAAARHQGPSSKLMHGVKWTEAKASNVPGLTREVSFFQLSNHPRLYCYDTPGVSLMKRRNDPERNTKLAVLGCMPDHIAGEMYLADYLLYRLNREQMFDYVNALELPGPTDDVRFLTSHISALLAQKTKSQNYMCQVARGATFFLDMWRAGKIGHFCLDHVPNADEVHRLRQLRAQTEPPGPWGPPCYPEVPEGLELHRRGPLLPEGFVPKGRRTVQNPNPDRDGGGNGNSVRRGSSRGGGVNTTDGLSR